MTLNIKDNYLRIYLGCMFSGKSTSLLNEISRYSNITQNILVVNHTLDTLRYEHFVEKNVIRTHGNKTQKAILLSKLGDLLKIESYSGADVVLIDEGQFFEDIYTFLESELNKNSQKKMFVVCGLSGDYKMQALGKLNMLIPLADEVIKLNAYCSICKDGTAASFTKRLTNSTKTILIGKDDMYIPVCRYHHRNKQHKEP
jgi:thymidine kinase